MKSTTPQYQRAVARRIHNARHQKALAARELSQATPTITTTQEGTTR